MPVYRQLLVAVIVCLLPTRFLRAQLNHTTYEAGMGFSSFVYQGDLTPMRFGAFNTMRFGANLFASKLLSPSFAARVNLAVGGLRGDESTYSTPEYRQQRNFRFRSPVTELSVQAVWNPLGTNFEDRGFSPYFFAGAGLAFVHVKRDYSDYNADYFDPVSDLSAKLALDAAHKPPRVLPVAPIGGGIRYNFNARWAVNAESSYRLTGSDYLDGFSEAANPNRNDHYHTITIGVIYRIGKKNLLACPTF